MKIAVVSRNAEKLQKHLKTIRAYRSFLSANPDVIVALGGDGTYLAAERFYPGVPKLLVREQSICNKCDWDNLSEGIRRILARKYRIEKFPKIVASFRGTTLEAVNDIVVRNVHPMHAIRFLVRINGKAVDGEFIGDGIVVSTAFGSEGYFRSVTREHFERGIGVAFNNTTVHHKPLLLPVSARIEIELTRGSAHVAADNDPKLGLVNEGEKIIIKQSRNVARIVRLR